MKDNYVAVLLEDINSKFDVCVEMASDVAEMKVQIGYIFTKMDSMERDNATFKAWFKDSSKQVQNHELRITRLETAWNPRPEPLKYLA